MTTIINFYHMEVSLNMAARNYTDPFVAHGIDISPEDQKILNHWSEAGPVSDALEGLHQQG